MSSAPLAVDSVPALYRALHGDLAGYLRDHFGVVVRYESLVGLQSYLVTSPRPGAPPIVLVVGDHVTEAEKVYLFTHTAAHLLLGHAGRPFATILEPRRTSGGTSVRLDEWQVQQERHADLLTGAILWGSEQDAADALWRYAGVPPDAAYRQIALGMARSLSQLLLGHKHRVWQMALISGLTRRAVFRGLRLVRALYHRSGTRKALACGPVVRDLREVYCLTELVTMAPDLLRAGRAVAPTAPAADPSASQSSVTTWLDIGELPTWRHSADQDRSRLN
jgi:hypothetical protein